MQKGKRVLFALTKVHEKGLRVFEEVVVQNAHPLVIAVCVQTVY